MSCSLQAQPTISSVLHYYASDVQDRRNRMNAARQEPDKLLPNIHKIIPREQMRKVHYYGGPKVTIYRSVPKGVTEIRPGDWVTLDVNYAKQHGRGSVVSRTVPAKDVMWAGTDMNEWFYVPTGQKAA